ncbi:HAD hydrolase-like protein [Companilactobacillus nantensis]|uniref:HAD-superfamily hydrolase, subfamily IA, variant 1 n=1 Tax=Companilactobacillus nantensis DSM 16982 TaxID=1423774 RepID=A0A0R1WGG0_9LACO|nr:HAD hydrolase-like protein [Companilactobacillus nantensis]KRM14003.1 HAD-superfamily hydrolase, subfamily IA, variant 1 [Companilactobacillus nantensis DSM 16982]GEO65559.1 phosphatase [Companilactobacillus nantensis]
MKNLFFDFDGTIANTQEGIVNALEYMAKELNMKNLGVETYQKFIGPAITESIQKYYPDFPQSRYPEAIKSYQSFYNTKGVYQLKLYDNMEETLAKLQAAGYKLYVSSVKPESLVKILVPHLGLDKYFSGIYGASDDETTRNTKKAILRYGMDDAGVSATESVMIGDRMTDMEGGVQNNVHTLGVTYGFGDYEELANSGAEHIVEHVSDIPTGVKEFD